MLKAKTLTRILNGGLKEFMAISQEKDASLEEKKRK